MIADQTNRENGASRIRQGEPSHVYQSAAFRRELVRRIVQSPTFARSERLGELLTFICDMALKGQEAELNEQKIGQEVFGRTQYYDSTVDGIVRTQASRLRQRLDLYFSGEGADEPVRIVIPRGAYVPVFAPVAPPTPAGDASESGDMDSPAQALRPDSATAEQGIEASLTGGSGLGRWLIIISAISALLLCICVYQAIRIRSLGTRVTPGSKIAGEFWAQLFPPGERNLILPGDSGLVLLENFAGKQVSLNQYVSKQYLAEDPGQPDVPEEIRIRKASTKRLTSFADLSFVARLYAIPQIASAHPEVRFIRDLQLDDLKEGNAILLGAQEADPWLSLFQPTLNFVISNDQKTTVFTILNRAPLHNEPKSYQYDPRDPNSNAYAVISYRANLNGRGNVLIVEGTGIAGLEAAADFLLDSSRFEQLLRPMLRNEKLNGHFEILLRTDPLNGTAPRADLVSVRYSGL